MNKLGYQIMAALSDPVKGKQVGAKMMEALDRCFARMDSDTAISKRKNARTGMAKDGSVRGVTRRRMIVVRGCLKRKAQLRRRAELSRAAQQRLSVTTHCEAKARQLSEQSGKGEVSR